MNATDYWLLSSSVLEVLTLAGIWYCSLFISELSSPILTVSTNLKSMPGTGCIKDALPATNSWTCGVVLGQAAHCSHLKIYAFYLNYNTWHLNHAGSSYRTMSLVLCLATIVSTYALSSGLQVSWAVTERLRVLDSYSWRKATCPRHQQFWIGSFFLHLVCSYTLKRALRDTESTHWVWCVASQLEYKSDFCAIPQTHSRDAEKFWVTEFADWSLSF